MRSPSFHLVSFMVPLVRMSQAHAKVSRPWRSELRNPRSCRVLGMRRMKLRRWEQRSMWPKQPGGSLSHDILVPQSSRRVPVSGHLQSSC